MVVKKSEVFSCGILPKAGMKVVFRLGPCLGYPGLRQGVWMTRERDGIASRQGAWMPRERDGIASKRGKGPGGLERERERERERDGVLA